VKIIDELTIKWDNAALELETYNGLKIYCSTKPYRDETIRMLNKIHHYDTLLYGIVNRKFKDKKDPEAEMTLRDIKKLEEEYTTKNFKAFIHRECNSVNEIEKNYGRYGGEKFEKEVRKLEKELAKYVLSITSRIDIIDEHIHHLKLN
jgi:3-phosphoglycerate kinase